jgi:very-short-patch-repair endonuclease
VPTHSLGLVGGIMQDSLDPIFHSLDSQPSTTSTMPIPPKGMVWMLVSIYEKNEIINHRKHKNNKRKSRNKNHINHKTKQSRISPGKITIEMKKDMCARMKENPTQAEKCLADALDSERINFRSQEIILGYIPDFYFPKMKFIVEVDGGYHAIRKEKDKERDIVFKKHGITTLRFSNEQVIENTQEVISHIKSKIKERTPGIIHIPRDMSPRKGVISYR